MDHGVDAGGRRPHPSRNRDHDQKQIDQGMNAARQPLGQGVLRAYGRRGRADPVP